MGVGAEEHTHTPHMNTHTHTHTRGYAYNCGGGLHARTYECEQVERVARTEVSIGVAMECCKRGVEGTWRATYLTLAVQAL